MDLQFLLVGFVNHEILIRAEVAGGLVVKHFEIRTNIIL